MALGNVSVVLTNATNTCFDARWLCWIEQHPGLASWVQAVGTILAVLVAVLVPTLSAWLSERARIKEARGISLKAMALAGGATKAFVEGARAHGHDDAFDEAFPDELFDNADNELSMAVAMGSLLGEEEASVFLARMKLRSFIRDARKVKRARDEGSLKRLLERLEPEAGHFSDEWTRLSNKWRTR